MRPEPVPHYHPGQMVATMAAMPNQSDPMPAPDIDPYADVPDPSPRVDTEIPPQHKPRKPKGDLLVTDEIVFGELPPEGGGARGRSGVWIERLTPLLSAPEQWARITVYADNKTADRTASNLRAGKMRLPDTPDGHFQFASRVNNPEEGQSSIWARYVTGPAPTPAPRPTATAPARTRKPNPDDEAVVGTAAPIPGVSGPVKNPDEPQLVRTTPPATPEAPSSPSSPAAGAGGLAGKS